MNIRQCLPAANGRQVGIGEHVDRTTERLPKAVMHCTRLQKRATPAERDDDIDIAL